MSGPGPAPGGGGGSCLRHTVSQTSRSQSVHFLAFIFFLRSANLVVVVVIGGAAEEEKEEEEEEEEEEDDCYGHNNHCHPHCHRQEGPPPELLSPIPVCLSTTTADPVLVALLVLPESYLELRTR